MAHSTMIKPQIKGIAIYFCNSFADPDAVGSLMAIVYHIRTTKSIDRVKVSFEILQKGGLCQKREGVRG